MPSKLNQETGHVGAVYENRNLVEPDARPVFPHPVETAGPNLANPPDRMALLLRNLLFWSSVAVSVSAIFYGIRWLL